MHILHIEAGRHLYGGALQVLYLLTGLSSRGIRSHLVAPRKSAIAERARDVADKVHEIPIHGELDPLFPLRIHTILRRDRPDLVHVHSRRGVDLWGGLAARSLGIPAVVTRRVDNPEVPILARAKYGLYERVITISEGIRRVVLAAGVPTWKVICVRSALAGDWGGPCERKWFQDAFSIRDGELAIGTIAQFIPRKGHHILLRAAKRILEHFPDTVFLFMGKGPLAKEIKEASMALGVGDRFRFLGFRNDLPRILPCLDLVVHPALMEGLGVSLIQAAACGVPIVATRVGGIPEIVRDGDNGILVPPGDSLAIEEAVIRLLKDRSARVRLGRRGRLLVEKEFGLDHMVEGNLQVYREILETSGGKIC